MNRVVTEKARPEICTAISGLFVYSEFFTQKHE
ncbi:Uncharacterised protein [Arcanobacterium haemolyticum]|nr:Uncharacterised protein [Arcanobacterium haemolyticum]